MALSPCELVPIDRELAAQAVSGDPELALSMMKYLARTVRLLSEQLDAEKTRSRILAEALHGRVAA